MVVVGGGPISLLFFCFVWWCRDGDGGGGSNKCDSIHAAASVVVSLPFTINHTSTRSRIVCRREETGVLWEVIHLGGCLCYSGPYSSSLALVRDFWGC
ncbi:hypothetical protein MtrunA17_Chr3g0092511 [Medicago truncatula]|uniref:Transmembrane protein n=1 Tax=Medicago truncatula TaxID=3880 RepID=A0A396ILX6_MEDTR|nr:hypothetical protein MtrunA17_Chr3g0092511 [Medicago truncatula]